MIEHTENAVQTPTWAIADCWQVEQAHTVTLDGNDGVGVRVSDEPGFGVAVGVGVGVGVRVGVGVGVTGTTNKS